MEAVRELGAALPDGDLGAVTRLDWGSDGGGAPTRAGGERFAAPGDCSVLCCRYLGASVERGARYLRETWRLLRPPLLGRPAVAPRIWAT